MKKAFLFLTVCFVLCGLVTSCSKDDKKNNNNNASTVAILVDNDVPYADSTELYSNQNIKLEAIMTDEKGERVKDYSVTWSCAPGLGSFSSNSTAVTFFEAAQDGPTSGAYISVDCIEKGKASPITKKINVSYHKFFMTFVAYLAGNPTNPEMEVSEIDASFDIKNLQITWSAFELDDNYEIISESPIGRFEPASTVVGQKTRFYPPSGFIGKISVYGTLANIGEQAGPTLEYSGNNLSPVMFNKKSPGTIKKSNVRYIY